MQDVRRRYDEELHARSVAVQCGEERSVQGCKLHRFSCHAQHPHLQRVSALERSLSRRAHAATLRTLISVCSSQAGLEGAQADV